MEGLFGPPRSIPSHRCALETLIAWVCKAFIVELVALVVLIADYPKNLIRGFELEPIEHAPSAGSFQDELIGVSRVAYC